MMQKKSMCFLAVAIVWGMFLLIGCGDIQDGKDTVDTTESGKKTEIGSESAISYLSPSPTIHAENPVEENMAGMLQEAASGAMVRIQVGDVVGSGVIWDMIGDKLVIVTAAHVYTMGNGVVEVTFVDGWTARIAGYDVADTDLAFLYVDIRELSQEQLAQYYLVRHDTEHTGTLQKGDGVILMGSSGEVAGDAYEGTIIEPWIYSEDFSQYMIWVDAAADYGMSGGGLFDYEGYFLGILCGTNEEGETVVLPLAVIEAIYG